MKVTTDVSKLEAALQENENDAKQMDITQYLIYMSKKACNYKLIIEAIQRCCENVDVDFYPVNAQFIGAVWFETRDNCINEKKIRNKVQI